jgi:hypothetical protein
MEGTSLLVTGHVTCLDVSEGSGLPYLVPSLVIRKRCCVHVKSRASSHAKLVSNTKQSEVKTFY